jgi:dihydroorotate dehydrogenase (NAD+) catalytic subunit
MASDWRVQIGPLIWPTPISLASGTCGWGEELEGLVDWRAVGAIFTKGLSLQPRAGHPPPRIWETASGMLNAIGLENPGLDGFVRDKLPFLRRFRQLHGGAVVVNLFGTQAAEYAQLAGHLDALEGVDGVEINLSCPNVEAGGLEFGRSPAAVYEVTAAVRRATTKFIAVKLSPASPVLELAEASRRAGADALCMGNTMPGMSLDVQRRCSRLAAGSGGLSGPALRPINLRWVSQLFAAGSLPIIGIGGIGCGNDAAEYVLAGASAVQVGTASFAQPNAAADIFAELVTYLKAQPESLTELVGAGTAPQC